MSSHSLLKVAIRQHYLKGVLPLHVFSPLYSRYKVALQYPYLTIRRVASTVSLAHEWKGCLYQ